MNKRKPPVIVIAGPTSSGKSDLAIALARKFNGEIISADSRQVYRGMNIGTGKVEMDKIRGLGGKGSSRSDARTSLARPLLASGIRHWLLDVASPKRQYTAAQWVSAARRAIADIVRRGKLPIICGGTGFWIDTLVHGRSLPNVKPDTKLRARLVKLTAAQLYEQLRKLDPVRAVNIDRHNPRRLVRALEIVRSTSKPVPSRITDSPYDVLYLGITVPKDILDHRIAQRLDARLHAGMVAEVRRLHASSVSWHRLESFGLEYAWAARFLQKKITRQRMRDLLYRGIVHYAKRQMTWLKRNHAICWISSAPQAQRLAQTFVNEYAGDQHKEG